MQTLSESPVELKTHSILLTDSVKHSELVLEFSSLLVMGLNDAGERTD